MKRAIINNNCSFFYFIINKYINMQKFKKALNNKNQRIAPSLPPPSQGCGCGGGGQQRNNIVRKVINKRRKKR